MTILEQVLVFSLCIAAGCILSYFICKDC
ncbi:hypothetical protein ABPK482_gp05 [Acinetobacter phage vB_AbaP_APK14]|uniref:Uncharacterized protein n=2 Tax=Friunavirus TaxID=1985711 RepID=A0A499SE51_9CAUD|nr:hypothetical protein ABPK482_gp05 [Acinetobacter phage vB_AbaP_APK14]UAW09762.1 hypothetical protein APK09_06 [Acinetobacter phage APK09]